MACIITYKNKQYTEPEFKQYINTHKDEFIKLFNKMTLSIAPAALYFQSQQKNN